MASTADSILEMFSGLNEADDKLQIQFRKLIQSFFQFLSATPRGRLTGTRRLRMRAERNHQKRIWKLSWARRIKPTKKIGNRTQYLTSRLHDPFYTKWVWDVAQDWSRKDGYSVRP